MDQSEDASAFSFGSVEDTFYENVNEQVQIGKLPYNPFLFDLNLILKKSAEGYESEGLQIQLNNSCVNIFGRKMKKKKQEQIQTHQIRHNFLAQTMSKNHFSIDMNHYVKDLGSKKGTYVWIHRSCPKLLQIGDEFLLSQQEEIKINSINKSNQKIQIQVTQSKTITLNPKLFKQRLFLIGSSPKCHFVNSKLQPFHLGIDLLSLTIHNMIEDEDCSNYKGTWLRIKEGVKIQGGDLILVYPYVFEVKY